MPQILINIVLHKRSKNAIKYLTFFFHFEFIHTTENVDKINKIYCKCQHLK